MRFSIWLEQREKPWRSEIVKKEFEDWKRGVQSRLPRVKSPSARFMNFVDGFILAVEMCAKSAADYPGVFDDYCISQRKQSVLRDIERGAFKNDFSRGESTWADGMEPRELGFVYYVLFGEQIRKPDWVSKHQGLLYTPDSRRTADGSWKYYNPETGEYEPKPPN